MLTMAHGCNFRTAAFFLLAACANCSSSGGLWAVLQQLNDGSVDALELQWAKVLYVLLGWEAPVVYIVSLRCCCQTRDQQDSIRHPRGRFPP